jgi:hypothetical protein
MILSEYKGAVTLKQVWWELTVGEICLLLSAINERKQAERRTDDKLDLDDEQAELFRLIEQVKKEQAEKERDRMNRTASEWDYEV